MYNFFFFKNSPVNVKNRVFLGALLGGSLENVKNAFEGCKTTKQFDKAFADFVKEQESVAPHRIKAEWPVLHIEENCSFDMFNAGICLWWGKVGRKNVLQSSFYHYGPFPLADLSEEHMSGIYETPMNLDLVAIPAPGNEANHKERDSIALPETHISLTAEEFAELERFMNEEPVETSKPKEKAVETSKPKEKAVETSKPKEKAVETSKPKEKAVETSKPKEKAVETSKPKEKAVETSKPKEKAVETSKPKEKAARKEAARARARARLNSTTAETQTLENPSQEKVVSAWLLRDEDSSERWDIRIKYGLSDEELKKVLKIEYDINSNDLILPGGKARLTKSPSLELIQGAVRVFRLTGKRLVAVCRKALSIPEPQPELRKEHNVISSLHLEYGHPPLVK